MALPSRIELAGFPTITVVRGPVSADCHGYFDATSWTIVIDENLDGPLVHVTLLHELLHAVETHLRATGSLRGRVPHAFLSAGDVPLLGLLVEAGVYRGVSRRDYRRWVRRWKRSRGG